MKKIIFAILVCCVSSAFAGEVTIHQAAVPSLNPMTTIINDSFVVDDVAKTAFVNVDVYKLFGVPDKRVKVYTAKIKVPGLVLVADQLIFKAIEADVVCGVLKPGAVSSKPRLSLTGNCKLISLIDGADADTKIIVNLKTI